jgi:hypothetical protein
VKRLENVTPEILLQKARQYLVPTHRVVGVFLPDGGVK